MMKKVLAALLALCAFVALSGRLQAESAAAGDWYAFVEGVAMKLSLGQDGSYAMLMPARPGEESRGSWEEKDGEIVLDGDASKTLTVTENALFWPRAGLMFAREMEAPYVPAALMEEPALEAFAGYWKSAYVLMNGQVVPAQAVEDSTDVYIEDSTALLGGPLFGDDKQAFVFENGALSLKTGEGDAGASVRMEMQKDGMMRLTAQAGNQEPIVIYLMNTYSEFLYGPMPTPPVDETPVPPQ